MTDITDNERGSLGTNIDGGSVSFVTPDGETLDRDLYPLQHELADQQQRDKLDLIQGFVAKVDAGTTLDFSALMLEMVTALHHSTWSGILRIATEIDSQRPDERDD